MNIEPTIPTSKNPPEQFASNVFLDIVVPHEAGQEMVVATVRFERDARSAWHSHVNGQYLRATQRIDRFGTRDSNIIEVHPGQTMYTPPGEEHWHAATENTFMEHIAMLQAGDDPVAPTIWAEHITDDQYNGK